MQSRVANQEDPICKCNSTKVDAGVKKSNRAKTRGWSKSGTNEKDTKEDGQRLVGPTRAR